MQGSAKKTTNKPEEKVKLQNREASGKPQSLLLSL